MHERNDNVEMIGLHHTGPWLVPARPLPDPLSALAARRKIAPHGKIVRVIVSRRMTPALAVLHARRGPRGAT